MPADELERAEELLVALELQPLELEVVEELQLLELPVAELTAEELVPTGSEREAELHSP